MLFRLLPQFVAAGDHPASCQALLPQLPAANAGTLRLLMQVGALVAGILQRLQLVVLLAPRLHIAPWGCAAHKWLVVITCCCCVCMLAQVCSLIHAEAAQNEMDALALAEVLVPCMAWKPPAKPQVQGGPGPWQGLAKALTLNKNSGAAAAAAGLQTGGIADAEAEAAAADEQEEASRVVPLEDAELEAVVTVVEYIISNFAGVFGSSGSGNTHSSSSSNGDPAAAGVAVGGV